MAWWEIAWTRLMCMRRCRKVRAACCCSGSFMPERRLHVKATQLGTTATFSFYYHLKFVKTLLNLTQKAAQTHFSCQFSISKVRMHQSKKAGVAYSFNSSQVSFRPKKSEHSDWMQLNFTTLGKLLERNLRTDQQRPDHSSLDLHLITEHERVTQFFFLGKNVATVQPCIHDALE